VSIDVRLDVGTLFEDGTGLIGTSFRLRQPTPASSGFFSITARSFVGSPFNDASSGTSDSKVLAPPSNVLNPDNNDNLGRTTIGLQPAPRATNTLAANLTLKASVDTPPGTYTINLTPNVSFATDDEFNSYDMSTGAPFTIIVTGAVVAAPVFVGSVSRKVHGAAGTFDLPLSAVSGNPTVEPRQGPAQTIVFSFDKAVNAAAVSIAEGKATAAAPTFSGNNVIVSLTGVSDQQYLTVALANVGSSDGGTGGSASVRIGFLVGDVGQNRVVSVADVAQVNAQLAQVVTAANYLKDLNASGTLTVADKGIGNAALTRALAAP
jgi:hypothetical protein